MQQLMDIEIQKLQRLRYIGSMATKTIQVTSI
jgi:hypothetical protein